MVTPLARGYVDTSDNPAWTVETRPVTGGRVRPRPGTWLIWGVVWPRLPTRPRIRSPGPAPRPRWKMWTGRGAAKSLNRNGVKRSYSRDGLRQYRAPSYKR